jgi:hypothetical protein
MLYYVANLSESQNSTFVSPLADAEILAPLAAQFITQIEMLYSKPKSVVKWVGGFLGGCAPKPPLLFITDLGLLYNVQLCRCYAVVSRVIRGPFLHDFGRDVLAHQDALIARENIVHLRYAKT